MNQLLQKPYIYWTIGIFLVYISLAVYFSEFYKTIQYIPHYTSTIKWPELMTSILFTLTIGALVAINTVYAFIKFQERKNVRKQGTATCLAAVGGFATGICPACVTGLFPLTMSALGISFTWSLLPFKGLEVQALIIAILGTSLYLLAKK